MILLSSVGLPRRKLPNGFPILPARHPVYLYYSRCCYKNPVESEVADWAREKGTFDEIEESWVYGVELQPDFSGIIGEPKLLLILLHNFYRQNNLPST